MSFVEGGWPRSLMQTRAENIGGGASMSTCGIHDVDFPQPCVNPRIHPALCLEEFLRACSRKEPPEPLKLVPHVL